RTSRRRHLSLAARHACHEEQCAHQRKSHGTHAVLPVFFICSNKQRAARRGYMSACHAAQHAANPCFTLRPQSGHVAGCREKFRGQGMRLGYFTMPVHPMHRNWTETLKEDREAIILADKLGFASAFMGEHLTDACEN